MSAYRSTLPKRKKPVSPSDFGCAPELEVDGVASEDWRYLSESSISCWNKYIEYNPSDICRLYTQNFQEDIRLSINFNQQGFNIHVSSVEKDRFEGTWVVVRNRAIEGHAEQSSFYVRPDLQGRSIGKGWIKSRIELSVALHESHLLFKAGATNGAYTWAKMGAHLDTSPQNAKERQHQSHRMISRLESLRHHLSGNDFGRARTFCRMVAKDDPLRLAELDVSIPQLVAEEIQDTKSIVFNSLKNFYDLQPLGQVKSWSSAADERSCMKNAFMMAAHQRKEASIGRIVMSGTIWPAVIDFANTKQMQKIGDYLGEWNSIQPT